MSRIGVAADPGMAVLDPVALHLNIGDSVVSGIIGIGTLAQRIELCQAEKSETPGAAVPELILDLF